MELDTIVCGDCLEIMPTLPDSSVDLLINDLPYYKIKKEWWDRQWDTVDGYMEWFDKICQQWYRLLKPNGSLYVFASPKRAARVEIKVGEYFNVLNRIVWRKGKFDTKAEMFRKDAMRSFFPVYEIVFLAEHYGADNAAKGESGYGAKCDELRGFVFEPLREWFVSEKERAGLSNYDVNFALETATTGSGMAGHYFKPSGAVQWTLPTPKHYAKLQQSFPNYFTRPYEDLRREYEDLRREYEDLRREYEDLRRPFTVTAQDQYTDVWEFPTVKHYPGKHPCEKPLGLLEHIVKTSSKPGDLVADFFCGSGATAEAAANLDRRYFCCDIEEKWVEKTKQRVSKRQLAFSV